MINEQEIDRVKLAHECYIISLAIDRALSNNVNPLFIKDLIDQEVERITENEG